MENQTVVDTNLISSEIHERLGKVIISWVHKPKKSNKFLVAAVGVIGALFVFTIFYGPKLLPWIKSVATWIQYLAIFALMPLFKYITSLSKDQMWSLHDNGFLVRFVHEGKVLQQKIGFWKDYTSCTYDDKGVRLIPKMGIRRPVRVSCTTNRMEVYSFCQERISIANAVSLDSKIKAPEPPKTREQRRLRRMEKWNNWITDTQKSLSQDSERSSL